jgi:hypothetical protein
MLRYLITLAGRRRRWSQATEAAITEADFAYRIAGAGR